MVDKCPVLLPPANEVCEGYVFTGVCLSTGGHAWLPWGGMCGCSGGACMVAPGGACVVAPGGHAWLLPGGACVVALGGHAWLLWGGMCGCSQGGVCGCSRGGMHGCSGGGMCGCSWGGMHGFFNEIRSMSGRYASYWNAFLFIVTFFNVSVAMTTESCYKRVKQIFRM